MRMILAISAGAIIGALGRYYVLGLIARLLAGSFPWGTLLINVAGSFLMGVVVGCFAISKSFSEETKAFLTIGVLGSFTTFSAFSLDFVLLAERKEYWNAFFYASGSVCLSIAALLLGLYLVRHFFH